MVCLIAAYHYYRIFNSFTEAYIANGAGEPATAGATVVYSLVNGEGFNEGYRYVDWLLTVPLLLFETVAVLALAPALRKNLMLKLIPASALMIILGYPGEIATDNFLSYRAQCRLDADNFIGADGLARATQLAHQLRGGQ